jgi:hypothetical protein
MARLIVEEGGQRRAFKVSDGVLSIGSGAGAALKLGADGVADLHADLVVEGGRAKLRPKPGVVPPHVQGRPVSHETALTHGATITIGAAKLSVEYEGEAVPKPAAAREKKAWERSRSELAEKKGLKPVHVLLIAIPVALVGLFILIKAIKQPLPADMSAQTSLIRAQDDLKNGFTDRALAELDRIPKASITDPAVAAQIDALRAQIEAARVEDQAQYSNLEGNRYLESMLKNFENDYLQGKADRPKVRVFLKRIDEFKRRWPEHPDMGWADRMYERYAPLADLKSPPVFADVEFEVKSLTWANPRNYKEAFVALDRFMASAGPDDRAKAVALYDAKLTERDEWYADRMLQARHEYEKGQIGKAVEWLVVITCYSGDPAMADKAATELLKIERIDERLRGYRSAYPDKFKTLAENRVVAAHLKEHPLD